MLIKIHLFDFIVIIIIVIIIIIIMVIIIIIIILFCQQISQVIFYSVYSDCKSRWTWSDVHWYKRLRSLFLNTKIKGKKKADRKI